MGFELSEWRYVLYVAILLLVYGSPLIAYLLYRAWKRGRFIRTLLLLVPAVPVTAAVVYFLFRLALVVLSALTR